MPSSKKLTAAAIIAVATMSVFAVSTSVPAAAHSDMAKSQPNIVETAQSTGVHNTLIAAVQAAGLVDVLSSPGPFTIFAPTDVAFAKLPEGTFETLVKPENQGALTSILTYHAVAGNVTSADLIALIHENGGKATIPTVAGGTLTARIDGGAVIITDAAGRKSAVTQVDVQTANGVIHITDGVFLPG
ncbi:MAG TPA: beta-Ig-H3/fasciclin [Erythrobacter sp.]|nr:beta-Ig-H3/fasciclin [Erythrobacter sp.]